MIRRHPRSPLFPYTTLFRSMRSSTTKKPCMNVLNSKYSARWRSEEHTSELQSLRHLVCRLLLEKRSEVLLPTAAVVSLVFYFRFEHGGGGPAPGADEGSAWKCARAVGCWRQRSMVFFF